MTSSIHTPDNEPDDCDEADEDEVSYADPDAHLRKSVYAAWRHANGRAVISDAHTTVSRYGPLKRLKVE